MKEFRLLKADEIECRIAMIKENGLSLLLYKDARVDQNILDETVGPMDWQRKHEVINGNLFCSVGIYDTDKAEWIWKQDVGVESYTEKEKGQASDAFKRACFNWGIGRELYTAPFIWVDAMDAKIVSGKCYDKFKVKSIEYTDHKITGLEVVNASRKNASVYKLGAASKKTKNLISQTKINILKQDVESGMFTEENLLKWFKVEKYEDITEDQFTQYVLKKAAKA